MRLALLRFLTAVILFGLSVSCLQIWDRFTGADLAEIRQRGTLRVITSYSANSYFIYRGEPLGYEYELLRMLADELGVKLELVLSDDVENLVYMLNSGRGDLVASNIVVTRQRARQVQFSDHLLTTRQVLVQRIGGASAANGDGTEEISRESAALAAVAGIAAFTPVNLGLFASDPPASGRVNEAVDLIGRTVHVRRGSEFDQRLRHLGDEIGGEIALSYVDSTVSTEELIRRVHSGEIDYTVADEPTALINRAYYSNIDVSLAISFPQRIAWVVSRNSPELLAAVNQWMSRIKSDGRLATIQAKYYRNPRFFAERVDSEYSSRAGGKLSVFDEKIQKAAASIGWDWRLLAALIYQESRFNPAARSWAGATGLMQLMPATGRAYGAVNALDPDQNLRAGVAFLKYLEKRFEAVPDKDERLKFVLASYNAGAGHVDDARLLAERFGRDPDRWENHSDEMILKLADPRYYNNYGVRSGYCRGEEPYNYVREILDRYEQYRRLIPDQSGA